MGTAAVLTTAVTNWNNITGAFKNFASGTITSSGTQETATNRALGLRQTASVGNPGGAFVLRVTNTNGFQNVKLTFKLQSLDATSPRVATWRVDYGVGNIPTSFTQVATNPASLTTGGSSFTNQDVTVNFGTALDNITDAVWIRVVTLSTATGSGNRPSTAIDDFRLDYTVGPITGPFISANPSSLPSLNTTQGIASSPQSYVLTAQELTAALTITAPTNFEVSINNVDWAGSQTLPQTTTSATVYARLSAAAPQGTYTNSSITNVSGAQSANVTVSGVVGATAGTFTKISSIQGAGNTFALSGSQTIEGIVTRTFHGSAGQNGFYVQEEDADQDGNAATSEGIFCYDPVGTYASLTVGDKVQVSGTVAEFASSSNGVNSTVTQLANLTGVVVVSQSNSLPTVPSVSLPIPAPSDGVSYLERFEGMLVQISAASGNLTVTEVFGLGQYGQVTLAATDGTNQSGTDARIDQYTQFNAPSVSGYASYTAATALRKIILDDGSAVAYPSTVIHARAGNPLSAANSLRGGDNVANITAILDERFDGYRLQTRTAVNFSAANPRPSSVPDVGGTLKVGFANVLNYFTTFGGSNDRGADNTTEFTRQRDKVIANLRGTGADIIGLSEIQNNGTTAIQDLVDGMNALSGAGTYTYVTPNSSAASDVITVATIYKPASVSLAGQAVPIPASYGTGSYGVAGRSAVAQTFAQKTGGGVFTLVTNHWKSKGSSAGGVGDSDTGDGQSFSNGTRTRQAQDLRDWLATNPTGTTDPDYLIVGDLNSYALETPVTTLTTGGYAALIPNTSYSFAFRGEWGSLDHALANSTLQAQVTGATKWYINSDEPTALDYNTENSKPAGFYSPDQYRSADHDPLVVGLNLTTPLPVRLVDFRATVAGDQVTLAWETATEQNVSHFLVERSRDAREFSAIGQVSATGNTMARKAYGLIDNQPIDGINYYRLRTVDRDGSSETSKIVAVTVDEITQAMTLMGNPIDSHQIQLAVRNMAGATYHLRSLTGQTIRLQTLLQTDRLVKLQVDQSVSAGVYLLEGKTGTNRNVVKVVID
ncbi:ExeM/NucH family extracellular endonuclease [Fibrella aquatica]|uniref:ExeM/NucH family extracellular endonuclease n=1 Tax=Fibrella aquatica TaxID=3242487 RepID=UPI0035220987